MVIDIIFCVSKFQLAINFGGVRRTYVSVINLKIYCFILKVSKSSSLELDFTYEGEEFYIAGL